MSSRHKTQHNTIHIVKVAKIERLGDLKRRNPRCFQFQATVFLHYIFYINLSFFSTNNFDKIYPHMYLCFSP